MGLHDFQESPVRLWQCDYVSQDGVTDIVVHTCAILRRPTPTKANPVLITTSDDVCRDTLAAVIRYLQKDSSSAFASWKYLELVPTLIENADFRHEKAVLLHRYIEHTCIHTPETIFIVTNLDRLVLWAGPILVPFLARGQLHIIGTATLHGYRAHIENSCVQRWFDHVGCDTQ